MFFSSGPLGVAVLANARLLAAKRLMLALLAIGAGVFWQDRPLCAQVGIGWSIPDPGHYRAKSILYSGYYNDAGKAFRQLSRSGIRTAQSRWIDSICSDAMLGECYYQNGDLQQALAFYDSALQLFIAYPDWMMALQLGEPLAPVGPATSRAMPWGVSRLPQAQYASFPRNMRMQFGQLGNLLDLQSGQLNQLGKLIQCDTEEVIRCTCLAIRRKGEILGPLAEFDDTLRSVLSALEKKPAAQNHWSYTWLRLELGIAYHAIGKIKQAETELSQATLMPGAVIHPLTGLAQFTLGLQAENAGDFAQAMARYEEASICAGLYEDIAIVEESVRAAQRLHAGLSPKTVYPLLAPAVTWAARDEWGSVQAWLNVCLADELMQVSPGETSLALANLNAAQTLLSKRKIKSGPLRAQANYLSALLAARTGKLDAGIQAMEKAILMQQLCSIRLAHAVYVDESYLRGDITARQAVEYYEKVLAEPTGQDWQLNPLDSLARSGALREELYTHWFEAAVQRKDENLAWRVAERAKRTRFLSSLPAGGRILNLSWMLETPPELLPPPLQASRQELEQRFPTYLELTRAEIAASAELKAKPLAEIVQAPAKTFTKVSQSILQTHDDKRSMLWNMAVTRTPLGTEYPLLADLKLSKESLPDRWGVLVFFGSKRGMHAALITRGQHASWKIANPAQLQAHTAALLKSWGNLDPHREIGPDIYNSSQWKEQARLVYQGLFSGSGVDITQGLDELVIVPDNFLWYLPFEALVPSEGEPAPQRPRKPRQKPAKEPAAKAPAAKDAAAENDAAENGAAENGAAGEADVDAGDAAMEDAAVKKGAAPDRAKDGDDAAQAEPVDNGGPEKGGPEKGELRDVLLMDVVKIRYAPLLGYAIPHASVATASPSTAMYVGRLYPRDDAKASQAALARMQQTVPSLVEISASKAAGGVDSDMLATRIDRLLVWQEWELGKDPESWILWQTASRKAATLGSQLGLPWKGPECLLAPGMQSSAASNILKSATQTEGGDIFWPACAAFASGSQTAVFSRWRVGGESTSHLMAKFLSDWKPGVVPMDAWRSAVRAQRESSFAAETESRLQRTRKGEKAPGEHPFFWAGYLLLNSGQAPEMQE